VLTLIGSAGFALAACLPGQASLRGDWGQARFSIEIADDASERATGLMHRDFMATSHGMLFSYEAPTSVAFWMRNTLIPLDMLFIDPTGRVAKVHSNAIPLDETPIFGGDDILAVLEINGGLAETMGIVPGTVVQHPAFGEGAAWPCP
jgi:uncharacterized protein